MNLCVSRTFKILSLLTMVALCAIVLPQPASAGSSSKHSKSNSSKQSSSKSKDSQSTPSKPSSSKSNDRDDDRDGHASGSNHNSGGSHYDNDDRDDDEDDRDCDDGHDDGDHHDYDHHYGDNDDDNDCGGGGGGVVLVPVNILNTTGSQLIINRGSSGTLTAQLVAGSTPVTYQWMKRDSLGAFSAIPGATSLTLTLFNTTADDTGEYWIIATNSLGSVESSHTQVIIASTLSILNTTGTNLQILPGGTGTLTSQLIAGTEPVTYQWMKRNAAGATIAIPGATSLTLVIVNAQDTDTGRYWIVATNATGSVSSDGTQVQVATVNE